MNGWMDGWMDGWVGERVGGWIERERERESERLVDETDRQRQGETLMFLIFLQFCRLNWTECS